MSFDRFHCRFTCVAAASLSCCLRHPAAASSACGPHLLIDIIDIVSVCAAASLFSCCLRHPDAASFVSVCGHAPADDIDIVIDSIDIIIDIIVLRVC
jgi:hypothetical protein